MRLLPKDQDWTAYLYLVYLPWFAFAPFLMSTPPWQKAAALAATAAAVALYFWSYWLRGHRVLWAVAGFMLMGSLFAPINPGASVLFVYAASCLGKSFDPPRAWWYLGALLATIGLEAFIFHYDASCWIPGVLFSAIVGAVVIQQCFRKRLTNRLLLAQEEAQQLARVAERERIARDLHDVLGHTLSVIILKSELASRLFAADPARAQSEIRDVETISRNALSEVRAAVRGYRATGLEGELQNARTALEAAGISLEAEVTSPTLTPAQETVFALALREAITNVVRHAHATVCRLTVRAGERYCEMEVADNGRGGALVEGAGLQGMRERVQSLGGVLELSGAGGQVPGTSLRIKVPV